ncbi:MAG TPA: hypothetical protein VFX33_09465 [Actinomycetales bacterium]|jgi:hypothetical protein|nr:hypothetical protein [Actinomycetales bacterium]
MADTARAEKCSTALQQMEQTGDADELLGQFSADAELKRSELQGSQSPTSDPDQFWSSYRKQFSEIGSTYYDTAAFVAAST